MEDVITLCKNEPTLNKYRIQVDNFTKREVLCEKNSATRSEFYQASQVGIKPELEVEVFFMDYEGEEVAIYDGQYYRVVRTYRGSRDYRRDHRRDHGHEDSDRITLVLAKGIGDRNAPEEEDTDGNGND